MQRLGSLPAISRNQSQSVAISRNQSQSVALSRTQSHSVALSRTQSHSVAISRNQSQSVAISRNQSQSVAIVIETRCGAHDGGLDAINLNVGLDQRAKYLPNGGRRG